MTNSANKTLNPDLHGNGESQLAELIVSTLNLEISPADITPNGPLYGDEGLGIDSIDILEISLAISKQYGVQLRSDDENNVQIFSSLHSLNQYLQTHRTK